MRRIALAPLVGPIACRRRVQAEERVDRLDGEVGAERVRRAGTARGGTGRGLGAGVSVVLRILRLSTTATRYWRARPGR